MKKVLVITSVASMVDQFLIPNIRLLQDMKYEVHVACNFEKGSTCSNERIAELKRKLDEWNITYYQIDFARDVTKVLDNLLAYKQVKKIISENKYELIHCHSPIGGLITRLASRKMRKMGTKVFYTAHGFHFYKGAPLKNWLIYYPIEKFSSYFTDVLITINQEDYELAKKKMKARQVEYIPGVGIDIENLDNIIVDKALKRKELGVPEDAIVLVSVGELNVNKNHETVIRALANTKRTNIYYLIAGRGDLHSYLQKTADDAGIGEQVCLLGYRSDIIELYKAADVCVFPSVREGLGLAALEGMACGLPLLVSDNRGTRDYSVQGENALVCHPNSIDEFTDAIITLADDLQLRKDMGQVNLKESNKFDVKAILSQMSLLYNKSVEDDSTLSKSL